MYYSTGVHYYYETMQLRCKYYLVLGGGATFDIPYSGHFSRGNIFMKVVILVISWKIFCGRAVCLIFWARARGVFRG